MSMAQSKLMLQLSKQQKVSQKIHFSEDKLEDLYSTISKIEPKNLMLIEFLSLIIEKNLVKNSIKIHTFVDMYQQIKGKKLQQEPNNFNKNENANNGQKEEQKFNKKKFLKLLKDMSKKLYPGDAKAYEITLFNKLIMPDHEDHRMKVDQNLKKYLNQQTLLTLAYYQKQFQTLFEVFMPENYNLKLEFTWNQIRLLEKRLPIICILRILYQSEICPQYISQIQFLQIVSKMIPPLNSNHKEVMFYYSETFNNYMRQHIFADQIKLLDGDIGVTFLQFELLMVRIATEVSKQNKTQFSKYVDKLMSLFAVSQGQIYSMKKIIKGVPQKAQSLTKSGKDTNSLSSTQKGIQGKIKKIHHSIINYHQEVQKTIQSTSKQPNIKKESLLKKQREQFNKMIQDEQMQNIKNDSTKNLEHQSLLITKNDIVKIKRILDDQLAPAPQRIPVDKENQGYFNVNEKFTVIGDQLPKIQQKNKPAAKLDPKAKKQDQFLGFKPQTQTNQQQDSKPTLLNRKKKLRINNEYPVILTEVFYPTSFKNNDLLKLKQQQEIYLETTYIHLGERMYQEAYLNYHKAKNISCLSGIHNENERKQRALGGGDRKVITSEFYFAVLEAQILQAAGKDQAALSKYFAAREIGANLQSTELSAKAFSYMGLSSAFYHLEDYQISLRCLLKAKQIYADTLQIQSVENAVLTNNIASCYMMMNRNQQAMKYFNLSHQILDLKVGRFDERTLVVQQNISKNKKAYIEQMPSFKTMWKTYQQKSEGLKAVKKGAKTKK